MHCRGQGRDSLNACCYTARMGAALHCTPLTWSGALHPPSPSHQHPGVSSSRAKTLRGTPQTGKYAVDHSYHHVVYRIPSHLTMQGAPAPATLVAGLCETPDPASTGAGGPSEPCTPSLAPAVHDLTMLTALPLPGACCASGGPAGACPGCHTTAHVSHSLHWPGWPCLLLPYPPHCTYSTPKGDLEAGAAYLPRLPITRSPSAPAAPLGFTSASPSATVFDGCVRRSYIPMLQGQDDCWGWRVSAVASIQLSEESDDPRAWPSASITAPCGEAEAPRLRATSPSLQAGMERDWAGLSSKLSAVGSIARCSSISAGRALQYSKSGPIFLGRTASSNSCTFQQGEVLPPPPPPGQVSQVCWLGPVAGQWPVQTMQPIRLPPGAL